MRILVRVSSNFGKNFDPLRLSPPISRTFARLKPTERAIVDFANSYGELGTGEPFAVRERDAEGLLTTGIRQGKVGSQRSSPVVDGERLAQWLDEIAAMRFAVELWDAIQEPDGASLRTWVHFEKDGEHRRAVFDRRSQGYHRSSIIFDTRNALRPQVANLVGDDDIKGAAKFLLQEEINKKLLEHTSSVLLYSEQRESFGVYTRPTNLLGALWLQLAKMVEGNREIRKCRECGSEFEVTSYRGGEAKRREFCRAACRVAAFAKRKARALELLKTGKQPRAIAEELGSDLPVVKRWITEGGEEKRLRRSRPKGRNV
jgi:transposase-like protein